MTTTPHIFKEGDRVAYRAAFLRSIGDYSYDMAQRRGVVLDATELHKHQLLQVLWGDGRKGGVLSCNVILADRIHLEPA